MDLYRSRRAVVGGIASGIYTTNSASQLRYLVNDSDSRFLFVENDEQLDKYLSVKADMPGLAKVIVYDRDGLHGFSDDKVIFLDDLYGSAAISCKRTPTGSKRRSRNRDPKTPQSSSIPPAPPARRRAP